MSASVVGTFDQIDLLGGIELVELPDRAAQPDLPGSGESDAGPSHASSADFAAALGDLIDSIQVRQFDLLAHDSGVEIALALAQQRPNQIGRVVLSPDIESVRSDARSLRQPTLLIDLRSAQASGRDGAELEHHATQLRNFLGLA